MTENDADSELMAELGALGAVTDPVPAAVVAAALGSYAWRRVDAELAELVYDSALDESRLVTLRGNDEPRLVTFEAPEVSVEVQLSDVGSRRRLLGQLVPPQPAAVEVHHQAGVVATQSDEQGRFAAGDLPAGPVRVLCRLHATPGPSAVATDWIST